MREFVQPELDETRRRQASELSAAIIEGIRGGIHEAERRTVSHSSSLLRLIEVESNTTETPVNFDSLAAKSELSVDEIEGSLLRLTSTKRIEWRPGGYIPSQSH